VAKLAKKYRQVVGRRLRRVRETLGDHAPPWARKALGPLTNYADMLFVDHGVFRLAYQNRYRLGEGAWRSAQPAPHHIDNLARMGIRTIVNLRGARYCGSYWLERQACARNGVHLEDFQMRSRAAPSRNEIFGARDLFNRIEYPMLMHCKSGADRAGLVSALYLIARENVPVEQAVNQLGLKYGHIRQANTGILDMFFERYLEDNARTPMAFFEWVEKVYNPGDLARAFNANGWANLLVNGVLRRE
jgi:protein tyrosine phosphatase (PTP) superfamily phosphohydrolase (DUF442 family)